MFQNHPLWLNILVFLVAAVIVWRAGSKLSVYADIIAERTGMGRAFVGLLLLATATSLPEVATTLTAGSIGNAQLLTGNLLGSVAIQTVILAVMDLLLVRKAPLAFFAPELKLIIDGVMLVVLLALATVGIAVDSALSFWGIGPMPLVIFATYVLMLWTTHARSIEPAWKATNPPQPALEGGADNGEHLDGQSVEREELTRYRDTSSGRIYLLFGALALVILIAGYLLARTGDAMAKQTGIGSTMIGVLLVAFGTALPEISTTAKAVRLGAYQMAISNIFGSNAFCVALLMLGDLTYRQGPLLQAAARSDLLLTSLGILVTCAYLWGMLERRDRTVLGMGIGSITVLVVYFSGIALLYSIT